MLKKQQQIDKKVEEVRIAKIKAEVFACRRCFAKYFSNIKFHEHIRDHYAKKSKSVVSSLFVSPSFTSSESIIFLFDSSKLASQPKILFTSFESTTFSVDSLKFALQSKILSSTSSFTFPTSIIFSFLFTSKQIISRKRSLLSSFASEFVFKRSENASFTFQKLAKMRSTSFFKSVFATLTKSYLIIEDFYIMFAGKFMRAKLFSSRNNSFFSSVFVFRQTRITVYFLSISKSTKSEIFTSMYDSIKQSIRVSFSRFSFLSSRFFSSIRFLFSTNLYFFFVC